MIFLLGREKVPVKWIQILLGKFVHIVQFRRPLFTMVEHSSRRVHSFSSGGSLRENEVDEWFRILFLMPLAYTDLRAKGSGLVTCSDASESGGGICSSVGITALGRQGLNPNPSSPIRCMPKALLVEWFAGIGGLSRSFERLGGPCFRIAVCDVILTA